MKKNDSFLIFFLLLFTSCNLMDHTLDATVYETSESGNKLTKISEFTVVENATVIKLKPNNKRQTITGFGGTFTEASASVLNRLSQKIEILLFRPIFQKKVLIIH